jgi:hypothetical protein
VRSSGVWRSRRRQFLSPGPRAGEIPEFKGS